MGVEGEWLANGFISLRDMAVTLSVTLYIMQL